MQPSPNMFIKERIIITRSHRMEQIEEGNIKISDVNGQPVILRFYEAEEFNTHLTKSAYIGSVQFAQSKPRF